MEPLILYIQWEIFACKFFANLSHESCFAVIISRFCAEQLYLLFFQYSYLAGISKEGFWIASYIREY